MTAKAPPKSTEAAAPPAKKGGAMKTPEEERAARLAAEAREEPNNHPALPDPLRKMPWDDNATVVTTGACACLGGGGAPVDNGNMAAE